MCDFDYFCGRFSFFAMKRILFTFVVLLFVVDGAMAQIPVGRTDRVTLFDAFVPAVIELKSGMVNRQAQANIFLKNSSLVYKRNGVDMAASMDLVKEVFMNARRFVNVNNQLLEVLDTCGNVALTRLHLIDVEAFEGEYLNNSDITNISLRENFSVTRLDPSDGSQSYPVTDTYFYLVNGKKVKCHEREVQLAVAKKSRAEYEACIKGFGFSWADIDDLKKVLRILAK